MKGYTIILWRAVCLVAMPVAMLMAVPVAMLMAVHVSYAGSPPVPIGEAPPTRQGDMSAFETDKPLIAAPSAESIIEACNRTTQELRESGTTGLIVSGEQRRLACLEQELLRHAPLIIDDAYLSRDRLEALLRSIKKLHGVFYEGLYTHASACELSCGSRYVAFVPRALARLYERMLRDVLDNRRRHNW